MRELGAYHPVSRLKPVILVVNPSIIGQIAPQTGANLPTTVRIYLC